MQSAECKMQNEARREEVLFPQGWKSARAGAWAAERRLKGMFWIEVRLGEGEYRWVLRVRRGNEPQRRGGTEREERL